MSANVSIKLGQRVIATVTQDTASASELKIGDYAKIVTQTSQRIDLTNYLNEARTDVIPFIIGGAPDTELSILPQVTFASQIWQAAATYMLYGIGKAYTSQGNMVAKLLTDLPYMLVAPNDHVPFTFGGIPAGETIQTQFDTVENTLSVVDALTVFDIPARSVGRGTFDAYVPQVAYGKTIVNVPYVCRPMGVDGKRLCWVNRYGAFDFWNFDSTTEEVFAVENSVIYADTGYQRTGIAAETQYTVRTRELPKTIIDTLAYILASPLAYLVEEWSDDKEETPELTPIDVITTSVQTYSHDELGRLEISFRKKTREI